jgi:hypothetical protein
MKKSLDKADSIQKAAEAYKIDPNLSLRAAATIHKVAPQSVINYLNAKTKPAPDIFGSYQKLSPIEESVLVEHCVRGYNSGFPLTIRHLNDCANEFLRMKGVNDIVGSHWHTSFFKRHPEIHSKFSPPIDRRRVNAEDPDEFIEWFRRFHNIRVKWGINDPNIYNMGESRSAIGGEQRSKVILPVEEKGAFKKQDGSCEWATLIECIRVIGGDIPSFLIVKGKHILLDMCELFGSSRATLAVSDNGWTSNELGLEWLRHFNKHTGSRGAYRLLILNTHGSHATIEFVNYAYENNIVLLYLPPHTTHRLQPLDVAIFGPLATYYSQLVNENNGHDGKDVSKHEWMQWILKSRVQANSESNIQSAWAGAGLVPFDPNKILSQLKEVKVYTSRSIMPEEQSNRLSTSLVITPRFRIQHGILTIELPITKTHEIKQWIDQLGANTPSISTYKAKLQAFIHWQLTDGCLKQYEVQSLPKAAINKKERSKKTIASKPIDVDSDTTYCQQMANKKAKKSKKTAFNETQKPSQSGKNNGRRKVRFAVNY